MCDLRLKPISTNRDYLVNRYVNRVRLDPRRHAFEPDGNPLMEPKCAACGEPMEKHRGLIQRLLGRLFG